MATSTINFDHSALIGKNLNDLKGGYSAYVASSCTNKPVSSSGSVISYTSSDGNYGTQLFISNSDGSEYTRVILNGTWSDWKRADYNHYYGSHTIRAMGVAISTSTVVFPIVLSNPNGQTPTVTISGAGITNFSNITATLDTTRTNKDVVAFDLTGGTFVANQTYLCYIQFTLS